MPNPIAYNDRALLVGKNGSGKSVGARYIFERMVGCRRVAIDPKGRLELGVEPVRDPGLIDWRAPLVHYLPATLEPAEFEALYELLWAAGGPTYIWLDEAAAVTTGNYSPRGLRLVLQQGREVGIGHMACTQRPQRIAVELLSEAEHLWIFTRPYHPRDLDVLAQTIGTSPAELDDRRRQLLEREGDHSFLWFDRNADELADCAPLPLELEPAGELEHQAAERELEPAGELEP